MNRRWRIMVVQLAGLACAGLASAQNPAPATPESIAASPPDAKGKIAAERSEVARELGAAKAALEAAQKESPEPAPQFAREVELLNRLDLLYGQVLAAFEHEAELIASQSQLTEDLANLRTRGPSEPRPFPFMLLENLRDQLNTEMGRTQSLLDATQAAQTALDSARTAFDERERARRQAKEALDTNDNPARTSELGLALRFAQLEARIAGQEVHLRESEQTNHKLESESHELRLSFLNEKIEQVAANVHFGREGLMDIMAQIDEQEYRVNQSLEWAKIDLVAREDQWLESRRRLDADPDRPPRLVEELEARRLARQARQREVTLLGRQLQALADSRKAWQRRFETFNNIADPEALNGWQAETSQALEQMQRDIRLYSTRLAELRKDSVTLESRIATIRDAPPDVVRWLEEQKNQLANLARMFETTLDRLEAARRLHEKLLSEINIQVEQVSWAERLRTIWKTVVGVWNYEITSVQDSPITVRKIVIGLVLLVLGIVVSRFVTATLGRRFLPRFGLNEGASAAIESLLFYLLVLTVAMLSLRIVNVPLTAFTILGGALAIGIGFGSQNIVNNFIGGLILLVERPIRVGDLIQIAELVGTVEHIGPRSTRVRAPENVDIVVPNSSFIENNVVNWTLSDDRCRTKITVGVVYGSPTRDVTKLIRKAVEEHGRVLPKPEPIILFSEFGDNALLFEAHFWVRMRRIMDRRIVESDVRYRIDSLFREAGIVIAFPQRDVHLDTVRPIEVRLLPENNPSSPTGECSTPAVRADGAQAGSQEA